jgi:MFS family permease
MSVGRLRGIHYGWIVLAATFLATAAAAGIRGSFGVYVKPLEAEFGWDRAAISGVAALSLLCFGLAQPLIGRLIDRYGPRGVLTGSLLVLGAGVFATASVQHLWQLYLAYGILVSLAAGGPSMATISSVAARWFETRRGLVIGLAMSGVSTGQVVLIPAAMWLTATFGWRAGYAALGAIVVVVALPVVWRFVRDDPAIIGSLPFGATPDKGDGAHAALAPERSTDVLSAVRTLPFWLLAGSYFVCGYSTSGLVDTHVVPYAIEHGVPNMAAASALGLMGAVNTLGAIAAGYVADRYGRRNPLAITYFVRGLSLLWLLAVRDPAALHVFAVVFGLSYIATVPPTTALTADLFGRKSVGTIFGWIFLTHQLGAAAGSLVGGVVYELTGNYGPAFISGALLCFAASVMVLAIRTTPRPALSVPAAS